MNHKQQIPSALSILFNLAFRTTFGASMAMLLAAAPAAWIVGTAASADETAAERNPADPTDAQEEGSVPDASRADAPESADDAIPPAGDALLTEVRSRLETLDSLKCDLSQTALIGGMKLVASGRYVEASGNRMNLRYVIYPMTAEKPADARQMALDAVPSDPDETQNRGILMQVSDGAVLFTLWKNADTQRVSRRTISDIVAAASQTSAYDSSNALMDLGLGGLRGLISRLQTTMEFAPVKRLTVGDRQVYEVTGRWNERVRTEVFQLPKDTLIDPRPDVPEYVRLYVDVPTMLPRRIQFLKRSTDPAEKAVRTLLSLDIRNVVINETIEEGTFVFKTPENVQEEDDTERVIQLIRQSVSPANAPSSPPRGN